MLKEFKTWDDLAQTVIKDITTFYNSCKQLGTITNQVEDVEYILNDYLFTDAFHKYDGIKLFEVSGRFSISLNYIGGWVNLGLGAQSLINYANRLAFNILDCVKDKFVYGKLTDNLTMDELAYYLKTGEIKKTTKYKFAYHLVNANGDILCTIYGTDNTCVYDYFKLLGAKNIKSAKAEGNLSVYTLTKDRKPCTFIIKRETLR